MLDLYQFLVIDLFGSLMIAALAVIIYIAIIGALCKMSKQLIFALAGIYLTLILMFGYGGGISMLIFFAVAVYFATGVYPWISELNNI